MILDELIETFHLTGLSENDKAHWNRVWHRLTPWPEAVAGLTRLRSRFILVTLSNGNVALLTNMAKHAGLPWDCILSAELARHYKPAPEVYLTAVDLLGLQPHEVMMVVAHKGDLRAAQAVGLRTAFVTRPLEYGPHRQPDLAPDAAFDLHASDFQDLATQFGV
jgi:2-haloacid dehalogenase